MAKSRKCLLISAAVALAAVAIGAIIVTLLLAPAQEKEENSVNGDTGGTGGTSDNIDGNNDTFAIAFPQGANSLFIGHSFFVPIAEQFDQFASAGSGYPNHSAKFFKRGGENGSPVNLWNEHKEDIEAMINSTTVELFGMTTGTNKTVVDEVALLEAYTQWIDLGLNYNTNMSFYIGLPWSDYPSTYDDAAAYAIPNQESSALMFDILITKLRDLYPNNHIFYLNYGIIAVEMTSMYERDELVDITDMTGSKADSIFVDFKGHAGNMLKHMAGLTYMRFLYGTPIDLILEGAGRLGWDRSNVVNILRAVGEANKDFQR